MFKVNVDKKLNIATGTNILIVRGGVDKHKEIIPINVLTRKAQRPTPVESDIKRQNQEATFEIY